MTVGPVAQAKKKLGPNEKCSCGSGKKFKKCCFNLESQHTPIQTEPGSILSGALDELMAVAEQAQAAGEDTKAGHFYTMAIDKLAKGLKLDASGAASTHDLAACNKSSDGKLARLLAARSVIHLRQGDVAAAEEDAATCTRADPSYEEGHLRLLAVFEAAGAPLHGQLQVCERGLAECPMSEQLFSRKWALKKAMAALPASGAEERPGHGQDAAALRNRGMMLLQMDRPVEAAEALAAAAEAGDEEATEVLLKLSAEAEDQQRKAQAKLEAMAAAGDERAEAMLAELAEQLRSGGA